MSSLQPAHRGYEYQDLIVAARSVDLLLGTLASAIVDEKLVDDDRFAGYSSFKKDARWRGKALCADSRPAAALCAFAGDPSSRSLS